MLTYDELDEYGKALADAYHAAPDDTSTQVSSGGLFRAHTNSGSNGPPPVKQ